MSKKHFLTLCMIPLLGLLLFSRLVALDEPTAEQAESRLRQSLLGSWILLGEPGAGNRPEIDARMKFWGDGYWLITQADPETGVVFFHHGGTYTLDGDEYEETVTFANENTKHMIDTKLRFKISVDGDRYTQTGIGNPFTEEWERLAKTE
jgi:hypothetical protein